MHTDELLSQARERLKAIGAERAALDVEEAKLRRMIAAAESPWITVAPQPVVPIQIPWWPAPPAPLLPVRMPDDLWPYYPNVLPNHGTHCACQQCCPQVLYVGDVNPFGGVRDFTMS